MNSTALSHLLHYGLIASTIFVTAMLLYWEIDLLGVRKKLRFNNNGPKLFTLKGREARRRQRRNTWLLIALPFWALLLALEIGPKIWHH